MLATCHVCAGSGMDHGVICRMCIGNGHIQIEEPEEPEATRDWQ